VLIEIGTVAPGAFGAMAALNRLASAWRPPQPRLAVAAADGESGATRRVADGVSSAPDHPHTEPRPGGPRLEHAELPQPTYWPAVMALGIAFVAWGLVTTFIISGVGLLLFALALAGWIGDLRHGH
jgi:hypothetical protein